MVVYSTTIAPTGQASAASLIQSSLPETADSLTFAISSTENIKSHS